MGTAIWELSAGNKAHKEDRLVQYKMFSCSGVDISEITCIVTIDFSYASPSLYSFVVHVQWQ